MVANVVGKQDDAVHTHTQMVSSWIAVIVLFFVCVSLPHYGGQKKKQQRTVSSRKENVGAIPNTASRGDLRLPLGIRTFPRILRYCVFSSALATTLLER